METKIASLWRRVAGGLVDLIIVFLVSGAILFVWGFFIGFNGTEKYLTADESSMLWTGRGMLVGLIVDGILTTALMAGEKQATFGQQAVGIKTIKDDGTNLGYDTAIGRWVVSLFSSIILKIGFAIAIFTDKQKTLHDLLAGTVVITNVRSANEPNSESRLSGTSHFEYEGMHSQYQTNQQYKNLTDDELLTEAVLGDEKSQFKIGQQYWLGENRIRDATVAYAWLRIAKESGSEAARFHLENTVFKQLHQQDIDNSIKLHESLKQAIKRRDVNFCELLIRKSLDDRNIIQASSNKIEINFSLSTQEYKEKYGINDYDYAKAINEMNGLLQDSPKNNELMRACQTSTSSLKQAEKKYIYTRAYEISKSLDRDAPSYIKPESIFKYSSPNIIYNKYENKFEKDREEVERIRNITKEPQWMKLTYIASYILMGISLLGLIAYSFTSRQITQSETSNQKTEIKEIKVVDDVMSYRISECSRVDGDELIVESVFEKIKINYSTNTITTFPAESQNQSMQVVNYEDCSLKDEKKSCLKLIDEKTKSHIKFDVKNNLFINEIISETDGNEAIKVKWACISSPIIDM